jgi:CRISPR/Cas system-associated endoribonuclease Cas2
MGELLERAFTEQRCWTRDLPTRREGAALQAKLRELTGPVEDQVRLYPLDERAARQVLVVGARVIGERQDFWIVS